MKGLMSCRYYSQLAAYKLHVEPLRGHFCMLNVIMMLRGGGGLGHDVKCQNNIY